MYDLVQVGISFPLALSLLSGALSRATTTIGYQRALSASSYTLSYERRVLGSAMVRIQT